MGQTFIEIIPVVFTPSEIMQAIQEKVDVVKLFPVNQLGTAYVKSLRRPFPVIQLIGVGGIDLKNIQNYYDAGCSSFAIGSELVPRGATLDDVKKIEEKARQYVEALKMM